MHLAVGLELEVKRAVGLHDEALALRVSLAEPDMLDAAKVRGLGIERGDASWRIGLPSSPSFRSTTTTVFI